MTLRLQPGRLMCAAGGCTAQHCCLMPTTTPKAPCTTVIASTCAGFVCPAPMSIRLQPGRLTCAAGGCTAQHCCLMPTSTPKAPCTTIIAKPTATPGPCTTVVHRLYSADQAEKVPIATQTWALPLLGLFAGFAMTAGIGASLYRRAGRADPRRLVVQSTRLVQDVEEPVE